jgi:hypothetical protein
MLHKNDVATPSNTADTAIATIISISETPFDREPAQLGRKKELMVVLNRKEQRSP